MSAWPAHRAMDAGSGRIVRVVSGDFGSKAGNNFGLGFITGLLRTRELEQWPFVLPGKQVQK